MADINDTESPGPCCVRKNPSTKQKIKDNVCVLMVLSSIYFCAYLVKMNALSISTIAFMHMTFFHLGMNVREEMLLKDEERQQELSLKQREHGARVAKSMTPEQEERLKLGLQGVVDETRIRNAERLRAFNRTPSNTMMDHASEDHESESSTDDDMPPLIPIYSTGIPRFSELHYLHSYLDEYKRD
jgi:hypothetical protein